MYIYIYIYIDKASEKKREIFVLLINHMYMTTMTKSA